MGNKLGIPNNFPKFSQIGITLCRYSQIADPHTDLRNQRKEAGEKQYEHLKTSWQKFLDYCEKHSNKFHL